MDLGRGLKLYSVPPPGSGIILAFILNIMENYDVQTSDIEDPLLYHRLIESFKYAYAYRSQIGDPMDSNITSLVNKVKQNLRKNYHFLTDFDKLSQFQAHFQQIWFGEKNRFSDYSQEYFPLKNKKDFLGDDFPIRYFRLWRN